MRIIYAAVIFSLCLLACNTNEQKTTASILNPSNLSSESFSIDITRDTVLLSKKGAVIKVPKGSITGSTSNFVTIELKEAYSMEDMLRAGLTTSSSGQALSSGGMIYINAKDENIKINTALSIAIPTPYINPEMSLFKGEEQKGKINWVSPTTLPPNPQLVAIQKGKELFKINCASCHDIGRELTGPDLAHIVKRSPKPIIGAEGKRNLHSPLYDFTNNWTKFMEHPYYRCVINSRPSVMPAYQFSYEELDNLYGFIENESELRNLPIGDTTLPACMDSCARYYQEKMRLTNKREQLVEESKNTVEEIRQFDQESNSGDINNDTTPVIPDTEKISPLNSDYTYYHIKIETFGWYNIDILMNDLTQNKESLLTVRIIGTTSSTFDLYLAVPSQRVLGPGGLLNTQEKLYGFFGVDGKIKLPQNQDAMVIAMGEEGDQLLFGIKAFTITTVNELTVSMTTITKEQFNEKMKKLSLNSLSIGATDSKKAVEIRSVDKKISKLDSMLKPKGCNCDCLLNNSDTTTTMHEMYSP